jgi:RimJ/RimL family protein N-acetyltransferase
MRMPPLETQGLTIRPLVLEDLDAIHRILDVELAEADTGGEGATTRAGRERWLQWTVLGYEQLALLNQPPYGERAMTLKTTGEVIGACGFVPCLDAFGQLPALACGAHEARGRTSPEVGLFWAVSSHHRRHGYATEAARALIAYGFTELRLRRIVATTSYDNAASIRVMEKAGMAIERNPLPEPPWLEVVGVHQHHTDSGAP